MIIVVGHRDRADDAAGLMVADCLPLPLPDDARLIDASGDVTSLLDKLASAKRVLVIDAVRSGASAGTIHRIDGIDSLIQWDGLHHSTHGLGVIDVLRLARQMDLCAAAVTFIGIEGQDFGIGRPSAEVERAINEAAALVQAYLTERGGRS